MDASNLEQAGVHSVAHTHPLCHLIAEKEDVESSHLGSASTVTRIRSRFWVTNVQKMVNTICNKCAKCRKKFKKLCGQSMKELPRERLQPSPPFTNLYRSRFLWPVHNQRRSSETNAKEMLRSHIYMLPLTCYIR